MAQSITSAEYFFNTDPGVGNGIVLAVNANSGQLTQSYAISTSGLGEGFHSLYIRTKNDVGNWSLYHRQVIYVKTFTTSNITAAEYFFNMDPGVGNGMALAVNANSGQLTQSYSISSSGLSEGFHSLYIRTKNDENNWSLYHRQVIYVKTFATSNITAAEYFFNTDPGVGSGIVLSIDANSGQLTQSYSISISSLGEGFHSFYIRTKDTNGNWSLYHRQVFYIKDFDLTPDDVTTAEYFIDTDPGVGNGTAIVFGDASQTTQILNIDATSIAEGD
ncbi:MAG: hypothetical protein GXO84_10770, partial [Chlorobi bacterium]|nr:hypothetical protein [Chlorobiota bacterium]